MTAAIVQVAERIEASIDVIRSRTAIEPEIALILGTGLGGLADRIDVETEISYEEIPHFPLSTVETHTGRLLFGRLGGRSVVAMHGRFHMYEGYSLEAVSYPVRVMRELGAGTLVVSNACGGMHPEWEAGDLVLITDHINLLGDNPLMGPNPEGRGPRFPDMSAPYRPQLRELARETALAEGIPLREGVYVAVTGPNLETRAEYRMLRMMGADMVGMSTVPEVVTAVHEGMDVLGISVVTDLCLPDALDAVDVATIIATAAEAEPRLTRLVEAVVGKMPTGSRPL